MRVCGQRTRWGSLGFCWACCPLVAHPGAQADLPGTVWGMVDEALIAEAGTRLSRAAGESAQVILFGSHARGDARSDSDLNFLVIEPEVDNRRAESVRLRRELRGLGVAADVVVVSADHVAEWGEVKSTMLHEALTEGRVLAAA
jgi:predicted nucleotidyltransferase